MIATITTTTATTATRFTSRREARAEQDRLLAVVRSQGGPGARFGAKNADLLALADCYEYLALTSSCPAYELGEARRLREQVARHSA